METIKFILEVLLGWVACVVSIAIALTPSIVYQLYGGTDEAVDLSLRCVGFVIWLLLFVCYTSRHD